MPSDEDNGTKAKNNFFAKFPEVAVGTMLSAVLVWNALSLQDMRVTMSKMEGQIILIDDRQKNQLRAVALADAKNEVRLISIEQRIVDVWPRYREMLQNIDKIADQQGTELTWRYN